jgi:hypothetical protein
LGYRTGEAGGRLVYEHGAAQVYVAPGGVSPVDKIGDSDEDDDDNGDD